MFYINVSVGILALLVLIFLMPALRSTSRQVSIDYTGAALLILGTVPLLLGFTLAGSQYAWLSPQIIGLFGGAVILLTILVIYAARLERQGKEPVFEPGLIKNSPRIFGVSLLVTVFFSISLYGAAFAIPLFAQGVLGTSATNSGLILVPFMLTSIGSSVLSGLMLTLTGKYKWIAIQIGCHCWIAHNRPTECACQALSRALVSPSGHTGSCRLLACRPTYPAMPARCLAC